MKYIKTIIMVIISISLNSICFAESISKAGNILIRSLPIECELSLDGNLPKDKINIKGGVFVPYPSDKWGIKKADDILYINNIPEGKYNITFKKGDKEIAFAVDIQDGKTCFVKCNFIKNKVLGTGQIYVGKDGYPMVSIPAGDFLMGSDNGDPDESPIHKVYLDAFYIDIYEVTNSQYKKFIDATGHKPPRFWNDPKCNAPDQPVVGVIYQDAMDYCKWAGKRLPTEAEWEKSARGGLVSKEYPWGDEEIANPGLENENPGLSSAVLTLMAMDCMIWKETLGSGVLIGMARNIMPTLQKKIRRDLFQEISGFCGADHGFREFIHHSESPIVIALSLIKRAILLVSDAFRM
jgi:hypothetical protein